MFVAMFLGCTSTGRMGLWFCGSMYSSTGSGFGFKASQKTGQRLNHPTYWEKPGFEPATPDLQDIDLSPTPRRRRNSHFETVQDEIHFINIKQTLKYWRIGK